MNEGVSSRRDTSGHYGHFFSFIRQTVFEILQQKKMPQKAWVSSYDPETHKCKVILQPCGMETGWLQIQTPLGANGFGHTTGLYPGQEVMVHFEDGDVSNGVVTGCCYNGQNLPVYTEANEYKFVQRKTDDTHSWLKFYKDGVVECYAKKRLKLVAEEEIWLDTHEDGTVTANCGTFQTKCKNCRCQARETAILDSGTNGSTTVNGKTCGITADSGGISFEDACQNISGGQYDENKHKGHQDKKDGEDFKKNYHTGEDEE